MATIDTVEKNLLKKQKNVEIFENSLKKQHGKYL